jgi:hypothetical protein
MAHPEGYRKAVRLMDLAEKFGMPVLSFPDTAGAYPGKGGEERGQAEAIARGTQRGLSLGVPFVTLIIGEGMSGGAIGIAAANRVLMMEYAIYSVISPEGCASILYRDSSKAKEAAESMGITAPHLMKHKIVDGIVKSLTGFMKSKKITILNGTGTLGPNKTVTVALNEGGTTTITGTNVLLAAGSVPRTIPGFDVGGPIMTSDEVLMLTEVDYQTANNVRDKHGWPVGVVPWVEWVQK